MPLDLAQATDEQLRQVAQALAPKGSPDTIGQAFPGVSNASVGQELSQIGQPQGLGGQSLGQTLGVPALPPQVGPRAQPFPAQGFLPGPAAGPVASPQFPQLPPAQGPGSPIPGVANPQAIPQDTGIGIPPAQGPDVGALLEALSGVRPTPPPDVVNPPSGQTNVGSAALAQNLIAQLFGGGAGAPLPIRLTG